MTERLYMFESKDLGSKAKTANVEVGKWYVFPAGNENSRYGKVVAINGDGSVEAEKVFTLPSYRPYASHKWFDDLPMALMTKAEEEVFHSLD